MTFDLTTLQEGEAFLRRPRQLSRESEAELIAWLEFVLNKLRARHARKALGVDGGQIESPEAAEPSNLSAFNETNNLGALAGDGGTQA